MRRSVSSFDSGALEEAEEVATETGRDYVREESAPSSSEIRATKRACG
jgi:hypothetical protein